MAKPDGYPLPWNDRLDAPYRQINMALCSRKGGREWQSGRRMAEIIPEIDKLLETV